MSYVKQLALDTESISIEQGSGLMAVGAKRQKCNKLIVSKAVA